MWKKLLLLALLMFSVKGIAQCIEPAPSYRVMVYEMSNYFCYEFYPHIEEEFCREQIASCVDQVMSQRILTNETEKERAFNAVISCAMYDL